MSFPKQHRAQQKQDMKSAHVWVGEEKRGKSKAFGNAWDRDIARAVKMGLQEAKDPRHSGLLRKDRKKRGEKKVSSDVKLAYIFTLSGTGPG